MLNGKAHQSDTLAAKSGWLDVENGVRIYCGGCLGKSFGPGGQFWSLENPLKTGYADKYGLPIENAKFGFVEVVVLMPGSRFITREAPGMRVNQTIEDYYREKLDGINPAKLDEDSRFGKTFYLSENSVTTLAELNHHGKTGTHTIRFSVNPEAALVLDLTNPSIAKEWGYVRSDDYTKAQV